jgi:hypothetical protein
VASALIRECQQYPLALLLVLLLLVLLLLLLLLLLLRPSSVCCSLNEDPALCRDSSQSQQNGEKARGRRTSLQGSAERRKQSGC